MKETKDKATKKGASTERTSTPDSEGRRRSRRKNGDEPEFSPGAEVLKSTTALVVKKGSSESKAEAEKKESKASKSRDSSKASAKKSSSEAPVADQSSKGENESDGTEENAPAESNEHFSEDSNDTVKTDNKSWEKGNKSNKDQQDSDDSSDEDNEEGGGFEMPSPYDDQPPNLEEKFDWLLANINGLVEKRLEIFAKKAGLHPSVATVNAVDMDEVEDDVKKPEFVDPVKPSTVENLDDWERRKPSVSFKEPVPPTRVEKMEQARVPNVEAPAVKKRIQPSNTPKTLSSEKLDKVREYLENPEFIYNLILENERNKGKLSQHVGFNKEDVYLTEDGFNFSYLNPWEKPGLNIVNDSTLAKLAQNERVYKLFDDQGEQRPKYDCKTGGFEKFRLIVKEKIDRMAMRGTMTVTTSSGPVSLVDRAQAISHEEALDHKLDIWMKLDFVNQAECDQYNDARLKSHILGEWLLDSVTDAAKMKLLSTQKEWMIKPSGDIGMMSIGSRYHGPLIYWHMVKIIKPNNDMMIEKAKKELKLLNCKRFNDDVSAMLIQFELKLDEIIVTLGGTMTEEEKVTTMWDAVLTCRDQEFCRRISDMRRVYRKTARADREPLENLIQEIKDEQVNMAADGIFNQPDKSRDHTLALTSVVEKLVNQMNSNASSDNGDKKKDQSKREIPAWKFIREGNETEKVVNGTQYYWCKYHNNPNKDMQGMWCLHKEEDHKHRNGNDNNGNKKKGDDSSKWNNHKKDSDKAKTKQNDKSEPTISVDRKLFSAIRNNSNVSSFLTKMKDDTSKVKGKA